MKLSKISVYAYQAVSFAAAIEFAGVNIAGFDFGCTPQGYCNLTATKPPLASYGFADGIGQMKHFAKDDSLNVFRLPVGWQYLVDNKLGGILNIKSLVEYGKLVAGCLATGATCIIDVHNYARWDGGIIGQGGPSNEQFYSLWRQLALIFGWSPKIIFGIVNEPHDCMYKSAWKSWESNVGNANDGTVNMTLWAETVQGVVHTIRQAGAHSQTILIPGTIYSSAGAFVSSSSSYLSNITDLDGTNEKLVFDIHQYLDINFSGTHAECVTDNVNGAFKPLATWLRANKRRAFLTETGGGNTASCVTNMCSQLSYIKDNADVYLGWVGWSAGSFSTSYVLTETPVYNATTKVWTDTLLTTECIAGVLK